MGLHVHLLGAKGRIVLVTEAYKPRPARLSCLTGIPVVFF